MPATICRKALSRLLRTIQDSARGARGCWPGGTSERDANASDRDANDANGCGTDQQAMSKRDDEQGTPGPAEVLFECRRIGALLRIAAIDPATNTEVVIAGPADAGEAALKAMARRKLAFVLARRNQSRH